MSHSHESLAVSKSLELRPPASNDDVSVRRRFSSASACRNPELQGELSLSRVAEPPANVARSKAEAKPERPEPMMQPFQKLARYVVLAKRNSADFCFLSSFLPPVPYHQSPSRIPLFYQDQA
jgi:hypothetical protein